MDKLPILQSGFISLSKHGLTKPEAKNASVYNYVLNKEYLSSNNPYFFNNNINKLYNNWQSDNKLIENFAFREELLREAFLAFGTKHLYKWVEIQSKTPMFSEAHKEFIVDTLKFIMSGNRNINVSHWVRLLDVTVKPNPAEININDYFESNTNKSDLQVPGLLTKVIQLWVSQSKGFEDLLVSLFVIFGYRPFITDVSVRP